MKLKILLAATFIIAALFLWKWRTMAGPDTTATASVPSCKVKLGNERDFGYRIGDLIPLTVELFEPKGFAFQLEELSAEGDFELRDVQVTNKKSRLSGTRYLLSGNAQSFAFKPKLDLRLSISMRDLVRKEESVLAVPVLSVYTSATYDGRMRIEENSLAAVHGNHWWFTLLIVTAGVVGALFSLRALGGFHRREPESAAPEPMTPRRQAMLTFWQAWQQWTDTEWEGPCHKMSVALRQWFRIESTMLRDVPMVTGEPLNGPITTILGIMENALYSGQAPAVEELKETVRKSFAKAFFPGRSDDESEKALAEFVSSIDTNPPLPEDAKGG